MPPNRKGKDTIQLLQAVENLHPNGDPVAFGRKFRIVQGEIRELLKAGGLLMTGESPAIKDN